MQRQEHDQTDEDHANRIGVKAAEAEQILEGIVTVPQSLVVNPPARKPV